MQSALRRAADQGGTVTGGERVSSGVPAGGVYVRPAIVEIDPRAPVVQEETFAPIVYVMRYGDLQQAIDIQNGVAQGLASSIFTQDVAEAERFCSAAGSDCGIANVNVGPSGAEIGGAFGGEKDTGGGRESGSDSWKAYMRRVTSTVNYSGALPLAQGVRFDV
jgi:aldehyde dehydrogenase (NAD+)